MGGGGCPRGGFSRFLHPAALALALAVLLTPGCNTSGGHQGAGSSLFIFQTRLISCIFMLCIVLRLFFFLRCSGSGSGRASAGPGPPESSVLGRKQHIKMRQETRRGRY